ncbi:MAG: hypothetical protein H6736_23280 [Alphaproteobacteria bacterium]|nr:hypothetical protein [Alphaproteobacteria bacterium]MCB9694745.1 hypothetical protein [Alphaproteobacteria bacterium]
MILLQAALGSPLTVQRAEDDLVALLAALDAHYVDVDEIRGSAFQGRADRVRKALDGVRSDRDLWLVLAVLVASLDDGHTYLLPPLYSVPAGRKELDLAVDVRDGELWLVRAPDLEAAVRITAVDGVPGSTLVADWRTRFSGETESFRDTWISDDFGGLYPWWTGRSSASLTLEDGATRTFEARVRPAAKGGSDPDRAAQGGSDPDWGAQGGSDPEWMWEVREGVGLLDIDTFTMPGPLWRRELRALFATLRDDGAVGLVVDVRGNRRGDSSRLDELVPHLVAPWRVHSSARIRRQGRDGTWSEPETVDVPFHRARRKPVWDGPIAVVTDVSTFSTAADLAAVLSDLERAVVVGEAPGGMPTRSGNPTSVTLPSGMSLFVATAELVRADPTRGDGPLGVDVPVPAGADPLPVAFGAVRP